MDWQEAKTGTIREWKRIRDRIGDAEGMELLVDINAVCDLCDKADQVLHKEVGEHADVASEPSARCGACIAFQQFGGCHRANLEMSEMVVEKNWEELRRMVDDFIGRLEALEVPS